MEEESWCRLWDAPPLPPAKSIGEEDRRRSIRAWVRELRKEDRAEAARAGLRAAHLGVLQSDGTLRPTPHSARLARAVETETENEL